MYVTYETCLLYFTFYSLPAYYIFLLSWHLKRVFWKKSQVRRKSCRLFPGFLPTLLRLKLISSKWFYKVDGGLLLPLFICQKGWIAFVILSRGLLHYYAIETWIYRRRLVMILDCLGNTSATDAIFTKPFDRLRRRSLINYSWQGLLRES